MSFQILCIDPHTTQLYAVLIRMNTSDIDGRVFP